MKAFRRLIRKLNERGQVAMIAAGLLPVLLGMTGLAIDVGTYMSDRRHLQNSADSIALAGSQLLPDEDAARDVAEEWAVKNDIDLADVTITIDITGDVPEIVAEIRRPHNFVFMRVLGVDERDVGARAAAVKVSFGGGSGIVPWSVTQETVDSSNGLPIAMKVDAGESVTGNFGIIRIDGPGAGEYEDAVMFGSVTTACAQSAPNCAPGSCPGQYPEVCGETAPECIGAVCESEPGNVIGKTRNAVYFRLDNTCDTSNPCGTQSCDTFEDTFGTPDANGKYNLHPDCNPWTDGPGHCTSTTDVCSRRIIIIPIIDGTGNGASGVTIERFALMWLDGFDENDCPNGDDCVVLGRFVKADLTTNALAGVFDEDASIHFTKLSE
ncbi:MAG: TadE/TadG family type IV pilus assembly protein [Dehalococcoidia bacterium]